MLYQNGKPIKVKYLNYQERDENLTQMGFRSYAQYLKSELWKEIRGRVVDKYNSQCTICNQFGRTVHHTSYDLSTMKGDDIQHLTLLCSSCHFKEECTMSFLGKTKVHCEDLWHKLSIRYCKFIDEKVRLNEFRIIVFINGVRLTLSDEGFEVKDSITKSYLFDRPNPFYQVCSIIDSYTQDKSKNYSFTRVYYTT